MTTVQKARTRNRGLAHRRARPSLGAAEQRPERRRLDRGRIRTEAREAGREPEQLGRRPAGVEQRAHRGVALGLRELLARRPPDERVVEERGRRLAAEEAGQAQLDRRRLEQVAAPDDEVDAMPRSRRPPRTARRSSCRAGPGPGGRRSPRARRPSAPPGGRSSAPSRPRSPPAGPCPRPRGVPASGSRRGSRCRATAGLAPSRTPRTSPASTRTRTRARPRARAASAASYSAPESDCR